MSAIAGTYVNLVKYRTDKASYKAAMEQAKKLQKSFNDILGDTGNKSLQKYSKDNTYAMRENNSHAKEYNKHLVTQRKLKEELFKKDKKTQQQSSQDRFKSSIDALVTPANKNKAENTMFAEKMKKEEELLNQQNKFDNQKKVSSATTLNAIKGISEEDRKLFEQRLNNAKTLDEFKVIQSEIRKEIRDSASAESKLSQEKRKAERLANKQLTVEQQKEVKIERFLNTLKGIDNEQKKIYRTQLMQQNTTIGLVRRQQEIRKFTNDHYRTQQKITAELNKQGIAAKRFKGSLAQMAGAGASVYTGAAVGGALLQTGMGFEAMNKTFLAVSDNAEQAAQHFQFIKDVSMTYGTDIIQAGKQFGKIIAAGRRKLGLEELKALYVSVTEAGVALGLSQDQTSRTFNALNQMLSKGQIYAEELRGQLGEHLPFAMEAMAKGAKEAGLIDKNITDVGELEKQLNKLMADGKLLSKDVLPYFAKALRALASGDMDAVATALRENLNPQLGIASNHLKLFGDLVYKQGVKNAVYFLANGFNKLMNESNLLGTALGGLINGVITGFTFPIRLAIAAVQDFWYWMKQTTGLTDEMEQSVAKIGSTMIGATIGVAALIFAFKKLFGLGKGLAGFVRGTKDISESVAETLTGKGGKGGIFGKMQGTTAANPLYVVVVGDAGDLGTDLSGKDKSKGKIGDKKGKGSVLKRAGRTAAGAVGTVARVAAPIAAGMLAIEVLPNSSAGETYSAQNVLGDWASWLDTPISELLKSQKAMNEKSLEEKLKLGINIHPDSNGLMYRVETMVNDKIVTSNDDMIKDAYMAMTKSTND